jgi:hypothetical protein
METKLKKEETNNKNREFALQEKKLSVCSNEKEEQKLIIIIINYAIH